MHELGIMIEVVKTVEKYAKENNVKNIDSLVLQVGELSSIIPHYVNQCYPAAVDNTMLAETKLFIETIPGNGRCKQCGQVFNLLEYKKICPKCEENEWELLSGNEFVIKEIIVR